MNRKMVYWADPDGPSTFEKDDSLPSLPLPDLEGTLQRYYETLKPFGNVEELAQSRKVIEEFGKGVGKELHSVLAEKAKTEKNWVEKYWENNAYLAGRTPLLPHCTMAQPLLLSVVGIPETPKYALKAAARLMYLSLEMWQLIKDEKLRPSSNPSNSVILSSDLFRRFYHTNRIPGIDRDEIVSYFRTTAEGGCPTHCIVIGRGRIFKFDIVEADGTIISVQKLLAIYQMIKGAIDNDTSNQCYAVPILTCDNRTAWAKNRKHLCELSANNRQQLYLIESALSVICLDDLCPGDYGELCQATLLGDYRTKWADKSSSTCIYRNGKIGLLGEHTCFDGSISVAVSMFFMMGLQESVEPDWSIVPETIPTPQELIFDLDDHLRQEIDRVKLVLDNMVSFVVVSCDSFPGYGKNAIKAMKIHPDAFVQSILQWTYHKMHGGIAATYETALMRHYYHGRTETVRSCTTDTVDFLTMMDDRQANIKSKLKAFRKACSTQMQLMNDARSGKGIDRHLFGLWCVAQEHNIDGTNDFYSDPLFAKSGGGGNFVLSTSTLGYTLNVGYVAPMLLDGYGVFYSFTADRIWTIITAHRDSNTTSAIKFTKMFYANLNEMRNLFDNDVHGKL